MNDLIDSIKSIIFSDDIVVSQSVVTDADSVLFMSFTAAVFVPMSL